MLLLTNVSSARVAVPSPPAAIAALLPVSSYFPDRSARWVADTCRAGRIPGAIKIGNVWMIRAADMDALVEAAHRQPGQLTVEDAAADLRRRGLLN